MQFQNKRKPQRLEKKLWQEHVWERQTIKQLTKRYSKGKDWVRKNIDAATVRNRMVVEPQPVVCVFDATKIYGELLLAARAPRLGSNLGWAWIPSETKRAYAGLRRFVEEKGFTITAVVLDGRTGIPSVFSDMPVQICQFHQLQIVRRTLTLRPETEAGKDLLRMVFTLAKSTEKEFTHLLQEWFAHHETFINEKTHIAGSKRWHYTHTRARSVYRSLLKNLPYLFTYQKHPLLCIPNTTNSLDGFWSRLKNLLSAHRGKTNDRVKKIVTEILRKDR